MDEATRDRLLAQWVVARGLLNSQSLLAIRQSSPDLVSGLQQRGVLDSNIYSHFMHDVQTYIGSRVPSNSNASAFQRLKESARLPHPGETFAGFVIESELGRGGMGAVFRARSPETGAVVALKCLLAGEGANDSARERFRREIDAMVRLDHPGVIQVYDSGTDREIDWYTMELLEGPRSLTEYVSEAGLRPDQAAELLARCAEALDHAHAEGLIHRDIKPDNLVVDRDGGFRIVDFGLARDVDRNTRLTQSGATLGTPSYMAPEQCAGSRDVDHRADVYAFGAILYELLAGRRPFEADSMTGLMAAIMNRPPDPPSTLTEGVSPGLEAVALKALEKAPKDRYQTAADFAEDLRRAGRGERTLAERERRGRTRVLLLLLLPLIIAAVAAGVWVGSRKRDRSILTREELSARAQRIEPLLGRLEDRLAQPGAFPLDELEQALALPPKPKYEGGKPPRAFRMILGRRARLEAEMCLRLERLERARGALEEAKKLLGGSSLERITDGVAGLILAHEAGKRAEALDLIRRALVREPGRGDLQLACARLELEARRPEKALRHLEEARRLSVDDPGLGPRILSSLGKHAEAVEGLEKALKDGLEAKPRHGEIYVRAALERFRLGKTREGLTLAGRGLALDCPLTLKDELYGALIPALEAHVDPKTFERFAQPEVMEVFHGFRTLLAEHYEDRPVPRDIARKTSRCAINVHGYKVHGVRHPNAEEHAFQLQWEATRWAPDDSEMWIRMSSQTILDDFPPERLRTLLPHYEEALSSAATPAANLSLRAQFQQIFFEAGVAEEGLAKIAGPTAEELKDWPVAGGDLLYYRMLSLKQLGRFEEIVSLGKLGMMLHEDRRWQICRGIGDALIQLGRESEALEPYAEGLLALTGDASIDKYRELLRGAFHAAGTGTPARLTELAKRFRTHGPRSYGTLAEAWIAEREGDLTARDAALAKGCERGRTAATRESFKALVKALEKRDKKAREALMHRWLGRLPDDR